MKRLLLVRAFANTVHINSYNVQEIGLCKAFCRYGYDCDIVFFSRENRVEEVFRSGKNRIKVIWQKGIVWGTMAIYPRYLNPFALRRYDVVISNEFGQIMSIFLAVLHRNVFLYNGPYFNTFGTDRKMRIYDAVCVPICNRSVKCIFSKTEDAAAFLEKKGIQRVLTVGVGLDMEKFHAPSHDGQLCSSHAETVTHNILYVGTNEKRKRVGHIIKVFGELCREREDVSLTIVGNISRSDQIRLMKNLGAQYRDRVVFLGQVENEKMAEVYGNAACSVLASDREIFGMVILESMYFGVSCVAGAAAGPKTIIEDRVDGILEKDRNVARWKEDIAWLLDHREARERMGRAAREKVLSRFTWDKIAYEMKQVMENQRGGTSCRMRRSEKLWNGNQNRRVRHEKRCDSGNNCGSGSGSRRSGGVENEREGSRTV